VGVLVKPTAAAVERLALQSPAELLAGRAAHLQELYKLSGCSQHQFDQVYGSLLTAFAGYVQALPAVTDPKTTLLDERLRAARARALSPSRRALAGRRDRGSECAGRRSVDLSRVLLGVTVSVRSRS
jgi:hypothetical protein